MEVIRAIVLGVLQGLTEFLPISSSAHLVIVPWLFGWKPFGLAFDTSLHLGTLVAVVVYFFKDLLAIVIGVLRGWRDLPRGRLPQDPMGRLGLYFVVATLPAAILGFVLQSAIDEHFHADTVSDAALLLVAVALMVMGLLLGLADRYASTRVGRPFEALGFREAMIVGFAQALALIPGVSRSGSTITAGLFAGMSRPTAARFSFLLGVPAIFGAGLLGLVDLQQNGVPNGEGWAFVAGFLSAAIVGYLAIAGLMRFIATRSMRVFVVYRLLLGLTLLGLLASGFRG
ncbi:MAG: undecaprenyl-diphosphatase UppP [Chloroflexi bacterium]|nr:MAG: undecaprenyl-diphosphatase UppP [Chloroflexota bacterium]